MGSRRVISVGTFGSIIEIVGTEQNYVAKRTYFSHETTILKFSSDGIDWKIKGSFEAIKHTLVEYAFARICGALEIGPKVSPEPIFDIVCYQDAIQYYMEKCESIR